MRLFETMVEILSSGLPANLTDKPKSKNNGKPRQESFAPRLWIRIYHEGTLTILATCFHPSGVNFSISAFFTTKPLFSSATTS